jgi:hypothetical protein
MVPVRSIRAVSVLPYRKPAAGRSCSKYSFPFWPVFQPAVSRTEFSRIQRKPSLGGLSASLAGFDIFAVDDEIRYS